MKADDKIIAAAMHSIGRTFMGGAVENRGNAPLGKGHDNAGRPLDINTLCYTKPVFAAYDAAIRSRTRSEIVLLAGVKTTKSLVLEICAADHICNRTGDAAIFFGSGDVADTVSTTRIMADMMGYERIKKKIKTISNVAGGARHKLTNGAIKFPDKTFFLLPANLNTLQQKNLGFAGMQDAFVAGKTGVIEEMIARTTQYRDAIVFMESQGGEVDFDFDQHYLKTNQGELHVLCPDCGKPHIFNWKVFDEDSMKRTEDFIPTPPLIIPSLDHAAWIEHNRPLLAGKTAGFQRGDDKLIKRESGEYIESAILTETHFECFHCGSKWRDDGEFGATRIHLDKTSHYVSSNPNALPNKIGFNFPQWINRRLTLERKSGWGHMMLEKLQKLKTAVEFGNYEPIKIWWQKVAARTWHEEIGKNKNRTGMTVGSYETNPENLSYGATTMRQMTVDTGKSPESETNIIQIGQLFFEIRDFDNGAESLSRGASRQIARGMVEDCVMDTPEGRRKVSCWELLAAQQKYWKISNRHVLIDMAYAPSQVIEAAVKYHEIVDLDGNPVAVENYGKQVDWASCWRGCLGSADSRIGPAKKAFHESAIPGLQSVHDKSGRLRKISLSRIYWSNYTFEDQFERIVLLKTAAVGWEIIGQDKLVIAGMDGKPNSELTQKYVEFEKDIEASGQFRSWISGLNSRTLDDKKRKYVDNAKRAYAMGHWTEPRDCGLMQLVGAAAENMLGHVATDE